MKEFELLKDIRSHIPRNLQSDDFLSDDAGILKGRSSQKTLFCSDILVEDVDFIFKKAKPEWIGRKALGICLSDIAAMGGAPEACVISLGLNKKINRAWVKRFYKGLSMLAKKTKTKIAGGDLSSAKQVFVSVAVLGSAARPATRDKAKEGDWIGVTGTLGASILKKQFFFSPRLEEARFLTQNKINAMIDVSDGFLQDLGHILKLSGKGAEIDLNRVPISHDAYRMYGLKGRRALRGALTDGEDFELIFTVSSRKREAIEKKWKKKFPRVKLSWVGRIQQNQGMHFYEDEKKVSEPFKKVKGYEHQL